MIRPRRRPSYASEPRARRQDARRAVEALAERPLISLVMPTYETPVRYLREAIESVRRQHYPEWELCIADDGSSDPRVGRLLRRYAGSDPRIKVDIAAENKGISAATNRGLEMSSGELVGFIDHDDALTPDALHKVAAAFARSGADVVYTDQDKITPRGRRQDPFFKPDWSPVYALGAMYIGHLLVLRRTLAEQAGGFDSDFDTIQDFEFMLRVSEHTDRIHHLPEILYHWRAIPGSIAAGTEEKSGVPELQARAVSAHLKRRGVAAHAVPHPEIPHRAQIRPDREQPTPSVSVVITAGERPEGLRRCLTSLFERTAHSDLEVIVVEGAWSGEAALGHESVVRVRDDSGVLHRPRAANLGAERASGELLLFLSDAVEVVEPEWIESLAAYTRLPGVGAVGPMLVHPDGRVDQAGVAIGLRDPALPVMRGFDSRGDGYYGSLPCARDVSAISADCMLVPRAAFERVGGFAEIYRTQFDDFDLCQRLRGEGLGVVYAPVPRLVSHATAAEREAAFDVVDRALFVDSWYDELAAGDPYFNPNFSPERADYAVKPKAAVAP